MDLLDEKVALIKYIDSVILRLQDCNTPEKYSRESEVLIKEFAISCNKLFKLDNADGSLSELIKNQSLSKENKIFLIVCLLRIISKCEYLLDDREISINTFRIFDEILEKVYKKNRIDRKEQTFQKINKLRHYAEEVENEISASQVNLITFDKIIKSRTNIIQKLSSDDYTLLIKPFLPHQFSIETLNEIFASIELFEKKINTPNLVNYSDTSSKIEDLINHLKSFGTYYSMELILPTIERLKVIIEEQYHDSAFFKIATIKVRQPDKKYPLISENEFNAPVILENIGPGVAYEVFVNIIESELGCQKKSYFVGNLSVGSIQVDFQLKVIDAISSALILIEVEWKNFNYEKKKIEHALELNAQEHLFSWEEVASENPYSLEPVETPEKLFGRNEVLNRLIASVKSDSVGSSFILGQKRVGKTSVVKTLMNILSKNCADSIKLVYLVRGNFATEDPKTTLVNLGLKISENIIYQLNIRHEISIPNYKKSDAPIADLDSFLSKIVLQRPTLKILIILDEFDELHHKLYQKNPIADAFFGSIRSITNISNIGVILVGGENMNHIINIHGSSLNNFLKFSLDYFDKKSQLRDYQDLVRKPIEKWFSINDESIDLIFNHSAGNPFFTKLICECLFRLMVEKRDSQIMQSEIHSTISQLHKFDLGLNKFQHFWADGISETSTAYEEKTIRRRKILLCIAELISCKKSVTIDEICKLASEDYSLESERAEKEVRDFIHRKIIIQDANQLKILVPLFCDWLIEKGFHELIIEHTDIDDHLRRKKKEEEAKIQSQEIVKLVDSWGCYLGKKITTDHLRAWLEQFGSPFEQRLIYNLLTQIKFYTQDLIRQKMKEAFGIVTRSFTRHIEPGKAKLKQILVSYLDSPGKSGSSYAKLFADENNIYSKFVVSKSELATKIKDKSIEVLVFVDDIIGTGDSSIRYFKDLISQNIFYEKKNFKIFFISITGFQTGKEKLQHFLSEHSLDIRIHICDELDSSCKVFSDNSKFFPNQNNKQRVKDLCYKFGTELVRDAPLGYGDSQSWVVFENSCPNNNLPILWEERVNWSPLFKRN